MIGPLREKGPRCAGDGVTMPPFPGTTTPYPRRVAANHSPEKNCTRLRLLEEDNDKTCGLGCVRCWRCARHRAQRHRGTAARVGRPQRALGRTRSAGAHSGGNPLPSVPPAHICSMGPHCEAVVRDHPSSPRPVSPGKSAPSDKMAPPGKMPPPGRTVHPRAGAAPLPH